MDILSTQVVLIISFGKFPSYHLIPYSLFIFLHSRYDLRMIGKGEDSYSDEPDLLFYGHQDTITGLSLSPDGQHLLSNGMDSTLRVWDVRPFAVPGAQASNRQEAILPGVHHGAEKLLLRCAWSANQEYLSCGSADK